MKLDGKLVIATNGIEVCGHSFYDISSLTNLLEQYAVGNKVRVTVEISKGAEGRSTTSEDGA